MNTVELTLQLIRVESSLSTKTTKDIVTQSDQFVLYNYLLK